MNIPLDQKKIHEVRREAMNFANVGIYRYRKNGEIRFIDNVTLRLLDLELCYPDTAVLHGKDITTLFVPILPKESFRKMVIKSKQVHNYEYHYCTLSGKERWAYHNSYLVYDEELKEEVIQVITQDITPLKKIFFELEASQTRYRTLAENCAQGICVVSKEQMHLLYFNNAYAKIIGQSAEEIDHNRNTKYFAQVHEEDLPRATHYYHQELCQIKAPGELEVRIRRPDGQIRWLFNLISAIEFDGIPAWQFIITDITEKKEAELRQCEQDLHFQQLQRLESLGVLAGGIAHDFNNLLFAIVANVEIIQSSLPDIQGINGNLSNILKAGEQATSLCSQLLNYAGKGNFDIRPLDLKKIISDSLTLVKVSISKKADIQMELPDHLPLIDADASQIRQVLINLLANASESFAGNSGKIIISAETKKYVQDELNLMQLGSNLNAGKYVTLRVKDNGSGMDETILAKIFDPFFTTKYTGRGLGLSAMLGILRRHGGAVRVTSKLGCGSEFVLIFPISSQSSFPQFTVEGTKTECNIRGLILAADDEPFVLDVIQKMLQRYGLQVVTAANGQEAVTVFQQHQKQIILAMLDVTMPKLNGVETFRELRKMSPNLPVIFCSGYNQESVFDYIKQEKSVCFLCKPFRQAMLKESIQTLLKQVQVDS